MVTHTVFNQPAALVDYNLFEGNAAMRSALAVNAPGLVNVFTPRLHSHDRIGHRIDQVEFHPSHHQLMSAAVDAGLHGAPWVAPAGDIDAIVERARLI